jgi:hypothetical protein
VSYNSRYSLEVVLPTVADVIAEVRAADEDADFVLDKSGRPQDSGSWRDMEETLAAISGRYRGATFIVRVAGEGVDDIWRAKFRGGKKIEQENATIQFSDGEKPSDWL